MIGNASDITVEPLKNVTILEGDDAEFECIINKENDYKVEWLKDNEVVYEQQGLEQVEFKLEVSNVSKFDEGKYHCRVSSQNDEFLQESGVAYLNVLPKHLQRW